MNTIEHIFYRNDRCLAFKVVDKKSDIASSLPTIVLFANNGRYVYQPYVFQGVSYIKDINEVKGNFQFYFIIKHTIYKSDKLDMTMRLIENDLKSGDYFPFGEISKDPFT